MTTLLLEPGSWTHAGTVVDVVPRRLDSGSKFWLNSHTKQWATAADAPRHAPIDLREFNGQPNTAEFQLNKIRIKSKNVYYNCCPDPYPVIQMEFELQVLLSYLPSAASTRAPPLCPLCVCLFPSRPCLRQILLTLYGNHGAECPCTRSGSCVVRPPQACIQVCVST